MPPRTGLVSNGVATGSIIVAAFALALAACSAPAQLSGGVVTGAEAKYRVGTLPPDWQRFEIKDADLAFRHRAGGTILANAFCEGIDDVPLDVLTNHLLFGIEARADEAREELNLDGRAALRTRLTGKLDG